MNIKSKIKKYVAGYIFVTILLFAATGIRNNPEPNMAINLTFELSNINYDYAMFGYSFALLVLLIVGVHELNKNASKLKNDGRFGKSKLLKDTDPSIKIWDSVSEKKLKHYENQGLLVGTRYTKHGEEYKMVSEVHSIIMGATGSGKTIRIILPSIYTSSRAKVKQSFIFTDPKGELFEKSAGYLKDQGYDIKVLNLRKPSQSNTWNPLELSMFYIDKLEGNVYLEIERMRHDEDVTEEQLEEKINSIDHEVLQTSKIEFDEAMGLADESVHELVNALIKKDPKGGSDFFVNAARGILTGIIYSFVCEDYVYKKIDKKDVNLGNIARTIDSHTLEQLVKFRKTRKGKKSFEMLAELDEDKPMETMGNFFTNIKNAMKIFSSEEIQKMTNSNNVSIEEFDKRPTALYIIIPDERESRDSLASLFVEQSYKMLVATANSQEGKTLQRTVHYLLDEFGNMPHIGAIDKMTSVARSRGVVFTFCLQSYEQLENVYGKSVSIITQDNCKLTIYVQTPNTDTAERFARASGTSTETSVSKSKSGAKNDKGSSSESLQKVDVLVAADIMKLDKNKVIVKHASSNPILTHVEDYWTSKHFKAAMKKQISLSMFANYKSTKSKILVDLTNSDEEESKDPLAVIKESLAEWLDTVKGSFIDVSKKSQRECMSLIELTERTIKKDNDIDKLISSVKTVFEAVQATYEPALGEIEDPNDAEAKNELQRIKVIFLRQMASYQNQLLFK